MDPIVVVAKQPDRSKSTVDLVSYRMIFGIVHITSYGCRNCEVVELNVQPDHVHSLIKIPPKAPISKLVDVVRGKHFWAKGYCLDLERESITL